MTLVSGYLEVMNPIKKSSAEQYEIYLASSSSSLTVICAMERFEDDLLWDFPPRRTFRVIIVGAGIAGLAAACGLYPDIGPSLNMV